VLRKRFDGILKGERMGLPITVGATLVVALNLPNAENVQNIFNDCQSQSPPKVLRKNQGTREGCPYRGKIRGPGVHPVSAMNVHFVKSIFFICI